MSLLALQRGIVDHLLHGGTDVNAHICGDAASRLTIYHNAYRMQLLACLRETFEKTWSWLGDTPFDAAGLHHIEKHPPQSWTLGDYGREFDQTLRALYPNDPEVTELAWLDWTLRRAFDGPNAAPISASSLAEVDWDSAILRFLPTLRIRSISTNSAAIWTAIADGDAPPVAAQLDTPIALRVWRQDLTPRFRSIETIEQRALTVAQEGASFASICSMLADDREPAEASAAAAGLLTSWLQDGLLIAIE